jgi:hypothetical protein
MPPESPQRLQFTEHGFKAGGRLRQVPRIRRRIVNYSYSSHNSSPRKHNALVSAYRIRIAQIVDHISTHAFIGEVHIDQNAESSQFQKNSLL